MLELKLATRMVLGAARSPKIPMRPVFHQPSHTSLWSLLYYYILDIIQSHRKLELEDPAAAVLLQKAVKSRKPC